MYEKDEGLANMVCATIEQLRLLYTNFPCKCDKVTIKIFEILLDFSRTANSKFRSFNEALVSMQYAVRTCLMHAVSHLSQLHAGHSKCCIVSISTIVSLQVGLHDV